MRGGIVLVEQQERVVWLTLNRPEAGHALSRDSIESLRSELARLRGLPELAALVLTGTGRKAFCAGADLKERGGFSLAQTRAHLNRQSALMDELAAFPRPTLAAINGAALGGGLELALACDIRIAVEGATLGLPEVRLGIIPAAGGTQRLARLCGLSRAKELILTGRRIDAATAKQIGLLSSVVPAAQLRGEAERVLGELAQAGPLALAEAKRAIDGGWDKPLPEALAWERRCYDVVLQSEDRNEGLRAFAEKRKPRFKGR
ncbi:MAG TPA: enoyl-CoA hydratase-related protein [Polyangia bacterium]|nr:enoyl-CoA hydratase-related protein [Polyangia bacterium]